MKLISVNVNVNSTFWEHVTILHHFWVHENWHQTNIHTLKYAAFNCAQQAYAVINNTSSGTSVYFIPGNTMFSYQSYGVWMKSSSGSPFVFNCVSGERKRFCRRCKELRIWRNYKSQRSQKRNQSCRYTFISWTHVLMRTLNMIHNACTFCTISRYSLALSPYINAQP